MSFLKWFIKDKRDKDKDEKKKKKGLKPIVMNAGSILLINGQIGKKNELRNWQKSSKTTFRR